MSRRQVCPLTPGPGKSLSPAATVTAELHYEQGSPRNLGTPTSSTPRPSITPTKKIELDRTIMPDGTVVTTVTTVQSRPRVDGKLDSPSATSPGPVDALSSPTSVQEADETTRSDISERPSVDDVESETGSTDALETRSLKDHKVSFLRSGTKLIFRRRPRQKEAGLSQSHDDLSNTTATPSVRKKAGSFSRRLIKRFSFKSKPKANGNPSPQL